MTFVSARERIATLFDEFEEFGEDFASADPLDFPGYAQARTEAASKSGEQEAVVTGIAALEGRKAVVAVFDFNFLGGSMGEAVGALLEQAMDKAAELSVPFVAATSTGGARMQEGMAALAQMPRTVGASAALASRGIPRIALLASPTTGGVYASFASLSDVIVAQAGATIGFAGPRIAERLSGEPLPPGSHTAEAAFEHGLVDALAAPQEMRGVLARLLRVLPP